MLESFFPAIICRESTVKGNVILGEGCILHPTCLIDGGEKGVKIGRGNVIEELVSIVNNTDHELCIGDNNWFHVGCEIINSKSIGNNNSFEIGCKVTEECEIGDYCNISIRTTLPTNMNVGNEKAVSLIEGSLFVTEITGTPNEHLNEQIVFLTNILHGSSMEKKDELL